MGMDMDMGMGMGSKKIKVKSIALQDKSKKWFGFSGCTAAWPKTALRKYS